MPGQYFDLAQRLASTAGPFRALAPLSTSTADSVRGSGLSESPDGTANAVASQPARTYARSKTESAFEGGPKRGGGT